MSWYLLNKSSKKRFALHESFTRVTVIQNTTSYVKILDAPSVKTGKTMQGYTCVCYIKGKG